MEKHFFFWNIIKFTLFTSVYSALLINFALSIHFFFKHRYLHVNKREVIGLIIHYFQTIYTMSGRNNKSEQQRNI